MSNQLVPYIFLLIVFVVVAITWMAFNFLLGWISGWLKLGRRWRTDEAPPAQRLRHVRYVMGFTRSSGLCMGATPQGLDLRVTRLSRAGHPPLRIPWDEIEELGTGAVFHGPQVRLRLGKDGPKFSVSKRSWTSLQEQRQKLDGPDPTSAERAP